MQVIHKDEDKRNDGKEADPVDVIICTGRVSRYMKKEYIGRFRGRITRI